MGEKSGKLTFACSISLLLVLFWICTDFRIHCLEVYDFLNPAISKCYTTPTTSAFPNYTSVMLEYYTPDSLTELKPSKDDIPMLEFPSIVDPKTLARLSEVMPTLKVCSSKKGSYPAVYEETGQKKGYEYDLLMKCALPRLRDRYQLSGQFLVLTYEEHDFQGSKEHEMIEKYLADETCTMFISQDYSTFPISEYPSLILSPPIIQSPTQCIYSVPLPNLNPPNTHITPPEIHNATSLNSASIKFCTFLSGSKQPALKELYPKATFTALSPAPILVLFSEILNSPKCDFYCFTGSKSSVFVKLNSQKNYTLLPIELTSPDTHSPKKMKDFFGLVYHKTPGIFESKKDDSSRDLTIGLSVGFSSLFVFLCCFSFVFPLCVGFCCVLVCAVAIPYVSNSNSSSHSHSHSHTTKKNKKSSSGRTRNTNTDHNHNTNSVLNSTCSDSSSISISIKSENKDEISDDRSSNSSSNIQMNMDMELEDSKLQSIHLVHSVDADHNFDSIHVQESHSSKSSKSSTSQSHSHTSYSRNKLLSSMDELESEREREKEVELSMSMNNSQKNMIDTVSTPVIEDSISILQRKNSAKIRIDSSLFKIPYSEIVCQKKIGEGGGNASVFLARWKYSEKKVAFKVFWNASTNQKIYDLFEAETQLMLSVSHPHIIRCFGAAIALPRVGIVCEYCENGDLFSYFHSESGKYMDVNERIRIIREVGSAMEYLHSRNIIHRDIKPENVLLTNSLKSKLTDFGLSKIYSTSSIHELRTKTRRIGTSVYMAPELVRSGHYSKKADVFSFGIFIFEIMNNNFKPYGESDQYIELRVANDPKLRPQWNKSEKSKQKSEKKSKQKNEMTMTIGQNGMRIPQFVIDISINCWDDDATMRFSFSKILDILKYQGAGGKPGSGYLDNKKMNEMKQKMDALEAEDEEDLDSELGSSTSSDEDLEKKENYEVFEEDVILVEKDEKKKKKTKRYSSISSSSHEDRRSIKFQLEFEEMKRSKSKKDKEDMDLSPLFFSPKSKEAQDRKFTEDGIVNVGENSIHGFHKDEEKKE